MIKFTTPLFILLLAFFSSCKKAPVKACINTMIETYEEGEEVSFSGACSENGAAYEWDFKDGGTSSDKLTTHIFTTPGTYEVSLKVYSKKKKSFDIATRHITIKQLPTQVKLNYVRLNSFPQTDPNGTYWSPDVALEILDQNTTYVHGTEVYTSATYNQNYTYFQEFPVTTPYDGILFLRLWNKATNQLMESIELDPRKYSINTPNVINLNYNDYSLTASVDWIY